MAEYPRVRVAELPDTPNPTAHKKEVDEALGISAFGFNLYTARPGERLPWGYHYHPDHEELLYVIEGELAIETRSADETEGNGNADGQGGDEAFRLGAEEVLFVPPGVPQCARAIGDDPARVIAAGAPKEADDSVIAEYCPACEATTDRTYDIHESEDENGGEDEDGPVYVLFCADCGHETDRLRAGPK